jgi:hypothetical protein
MEGIERVVSRDVQILRGFAYPPLRRVWFDRETVLMALTDLRSVFSRTVEDYYRLGISTRPKFCLLMIVVRETEATNSAAL